MSPFDFNVGDMQVRNVRINGRRTKIRLEPYLWEALSDIAAREGGDADELLSRLETHLKDRGTVGNFTSALRTYIVHYFRTAAPLSPERID